MGCVDSKEKKKDSSVRASIMRDDSSGGIAAPVIIEEDDYPSPQQQPQTQSSPSSKYKSGGPRLEGEEEEIQECFKGGMLYKIIRKDGGWAFYNDTQEYEMHVHYKFGPDSKIRPASGFVKVERDATDNWIIYELVIYPGETKDYLCGKYNGFKNSLAAKPLSDEYRAKMNAEANKNVEVQMETVKKFARLGWTEETLLETCMRQGCPYVDLNFPPTDNSLSRPGEDRRKLASQAWKRPTDFLPVTEHDKISVIKGIDPNDIDQGQLGDCWFLCSVASLAEFPSKIKDVFKHPVGGEEAKEEAKVGAYRVTLNKHGWWQVFIVDDFFPVIGNRPCFAKNLEDPGELWVSLLEKAYAKAHGSYATITGGDALHALQDLCGYPINRFDTEWEDALKDPNYSNELFDDIVRYDESGYLINLNTPGQDNSAYMGASAKGNAKEFEEKYKKAGLGMGHAYSVLEAKKFPEKDLRLLKVRNPWGNGTEWTGAWSDDDPRWQQNPNIAAACKFEAASDGTFWMEWEDVKEYFDGGGVCFMKTGWHDYRIAGGFVDGFPNCVLEVTCKKKKVDAFLVISQKDKRGLSASDPDADYKAMMLSVTKGVPGSHRQQVHLNSSADADKPTEKLTFSYSRDLSLTYTFEPSEQPYLVVPRIYDAGASKNYVLGLIAETFVSDDFRVKFKWLSNETKVFHNYPKFDYDGSTKGGKDFETFFQYNPEVGCPITKKGVELQNR